MMVLQATHYFDGMLYHGCTHTLILVNDGLVYRRVHNLAATFSRLQSVGFRFKGVYLKYYATE